MRGRITVQDMSGKELSEVVAAVDDYLYQIDPYFLLTVLAERLRWVNKFYGDKLAPERET